MYIITQFTGTRCIRDDYTCGSLAGSGCGSPIGVLAGKELRQLHGEVSTKPDLAAGDVENVG